MDKEHLNNHGKIRCPVAGTWVAICPLDTPVLTEYLPSSKCYECELKPQNIY